MQFFHVPGARGKVAGFVHAGDSDLVLVPYRTSDMLTGLGGSRVTLLAVGIVLAKLAGDLELGSRPAELVDQEHSRWNWAA